MPTYEQVASEVGSLMKQISFVASKGSGGPMFAVPVTEATTAGNLDMRNGAFTNGVD
jgi:hypothetical protein